MTFEMVKGRKDFRGKNETRRLRQKEDQLQIAITQSLRNTVLRPQVTAICRLESSPSVVSESTVIQLPERPQPAYIGAASRTDLTNFTSSEVTLQQCCSQPLPLQAGPKANKMALTKSQKIGILLVIDSVFFLVELIIGYAVHSLALVADAFHMLNDVLSLFVGLWAVRVAQSGSSKMYTYGWQRAETLGALVNGVFLVALCVTIFLEAIQRFVEKPNVTNPQLVLIVGCIGLASNILGLFLFHDHGHSHGGHSHGDEAGEAEEGHAHSHGHSHDHTEHAHDHPEIDAHDHAHKHTPTETSPLMQKNSPMPKFSTPKFSKSDEDNSTLSPNSTNTPKKVVSAPADSRKSISNGIEGTYRHRRRTSGFGSVFDIPTHPASFRDNVIQAARYQDDPVDEDVIHEETQDDHNHDHNHDSHTQTNGHARHPSAPNAHKHHNHNQPKDQKSSGGHGHSHADLNMRGVFLHVMGDALGNIGVIITALIIWLCKFPGRFYFDPAISLVITCIILWSAIPLCKAASRILLQAVPVGLSIDEIRADIEDLPQVVEAHHLHVWQLSDTKLVASLHVKVDCEVDGSGSASYMRLAREIRACLHGYGIHSSTIQPEFLKKGTPNDLLDSDEESPAGSSKLPAPGGKASKAGSLLSADGHVAGPGCMMDCEDTCGSQGQCCPSTDGKGPK